MAGSERLTFDEVGRLPAPGDNVAIATRRIEAGTRVAYEGSEFTVPHTVLEGHRFAVERIGEGEDLLSWGLTFGQATKDIGPGDYACNEKILRVLRERHGTSPRLDGDEDPEGTHDQGGGRLPGGYRREGPGSARRTQLPRRRARGLRPGRGNLQARCSGSTVRRAAHLHGLPARRGPWRRDAQLRRRDGRHLAAHRVREGAGVGDEGVADACENVSGIVCVAHTEGGEDRTPNNLDLLLRTLSGFMVNPNVGAVLSLDHGGQEAVTNEMLRSYLENNSYPIEDVPHEFMSLEGNFRADLERAKSVVSGWLEEVNGARRTEEPVSELKIGLQCGGSDAFSGVSANPLVGWVSKEIVRNGGAANLAETDELIGAERYVLRQCEGPGHRSPLPPYGRAVQGAGRLARPHG